MKGIPRPLGGGFVLAGHAVADAVQAGAPRARWGALRWGIEVLGRLHERQRRRCGRRGKERACHEFRLSLGQFCLESGFGRDKARMVLRELAGLGLITFPGGAGRDDRAGVPRLICLSFLAPGWAADAPVADGDLVEGYLESVGR